MAYPGEDRIMGYTHYWSHPTVSAPEWDRLVTDAKRILAASDVKVAGRAGTGRPVLNSDRIELNGVRSAGNDYETFLLCPIETDYDFCKTGTRPYDVIVCAILLRAREIISGFNLWSDGDIEGEDWADGRALYVQVFGDQTVTA